LGQFNYDTGPQINVDDLIMQSRLKRRTSRGELIQRRRSVKPDPTGLGDTQDEPIVEIEKAEETPKQDREANSSVVKPVSSDQKEFLQSIYNKYFKKDESQLNNHDERRYSSPETPSPKKSPIRIKTSFDSGSRLS